MTVDYVCPLVSLTKTERKGLQWKQQIVEDIRNCVQKYPNVFLFSVTNMRNNLLKELRSEWKQNSRFFFGKNRIMQLGLGKNSSDPDTDPELLKLSARLHGQCGLLFTDKSKEEVIEWSQCYNALEYARSGFVATETVTLPEGIIIDVCVKLTPKLNATAFCVFYYVQVRWRTFHTRSSRICERLAFPRNCTRESFTCTRSTPFARREKC